MLLTTRLLLTCFCIFIIRHFSLAVKAPLGVHIPLGTPDDAVYAPGECDASFVHPNVSQRYPPNFVKWHPHASHMAFPSCPPPSQRPTFDLVKDFGAVGDNKTDNTNAIAGAIAAVRKAGGGIVIVPKGTFLTRPFNLTSCMALHLLDTDSILQAPFGGIDFWPLIQVEGVERYSDFISGHSITDVSIVGKGVIDGAGWIFWQAKNHNKLKYRRPNLITFFASQFITLDGVSLRSSPCYNINPILSKHIWAAHLNITNPLDVLNTDGLDPDSCTNVTFTSSALSTGDDIVAVKTHDVPSNDILMKNITAASAECGFCVGSHAWSGGSNIRIQNSHFTTVKHGFCFKGSRGTGGTVTNFTLHEVSIENADVSAIWITDYFYGSINGSMVVPRLNQVSVSRFTVGTVGVAAGILLGLRDSLITNISIRHFNVINFPPSPWQCEYIRGTYFNVSPSIADCKGLTPENGTNIRRLELSFTQT